MEESRENVKKWKELYQGLLQIMNDDNKRFNVMYDKLKELECELPFEYAAKLAKILDWESE